MTSPKNKVKTVSKSAVATSKTVETTAPTVETQAVKVNKAKVKKVMPRDLGLIKFVGQGGVSSLPQLHQVFTKLSDRPTTQERTCRERLAQLEKTGYLQSQFVDVRTRGELVFTMTEEGAKLFSKVERKRFIMSLPNHSELKQQLVGQDTRLVLEESLAKEGYRLVDWQHERELRSRQKQTGKQQAGGGSSPPVPTSAYRGSSRKKKKTEMDIGDARAVFVNSQGKDLTLEIEVDGQYYGKMLKNKLTYFANSGKETIWATDSTKRAAHVKELIDSEEFGPAKNIRVLVV